MSEVPRSKPDQGVKIGELNRMTFVHGDLGSEWIMGPRDLPVDLSEWA